MNNPGQCPGLRPCELTLWTRFATFGAHGGGTMPPKMSAKDALCIAIAKAVAWAQFSATRRVPRPSATGGNR